MDVEDKEEFSQRRSRSESRRLRKKRKSLSGEVLDGKKKRSNRFELLASCTGLIVVLFVFSGFNNSILLAYFAGLVVSQLSQVEVKSFLSEFYSALADSPLFSFFLKHPKGLQKGKGSRSGSFLARIESRIGAILFNTEEVDGSHFQDAEDAGKEGIFLYVMNGDLKKVQKNLVETVGERNMANATPFLFSVLLRKSEIIKMYLANEDICDIALAQQYGKGIYEGENALHIAIAQKDEQLVRLLVGAAKEHGVAEELLYARAHGSFFSPLTDSSIHNEATTISLCYNSPVLYGRSLNHLYFGEFPLAFAVSTNQRDVFDFLLEEQEYDVSEDSRGNNILHIAVVHNLPGMVEHILKRFDKENHAESRQKLLQSKNNDGLTPLSLATALGHTQVFDALVKSIRQLYWEYASIKAYLFPMKDLLEENGVLECVVRNKHTDLAEHPLIASILVKQWDAGFDRLFRIKLYTWSFYLLVLTTAALTGLSWTRDGDQSATGTQYLACIFLFYLAGHKLFVEFVEFSESGLKYFQGSPTELIENLCSVCSCASAVLAVSFGSRLLFALSLFTGWLYVLFFLLGFRSTGTFVTIIIRLLVDDVLVFSSVMSVIVLAFANFFFHVVEGDSFEEFMQHLDQSFQTILGDYDISNYREAPKNSLLMSLISVVYALFISVTLINTLIAKMSNEYETISGRQGLYWILERGRIMQSIANENGGFKKLVLGQHKQSQKKRRQKSLPILRKFWIVESAAEKSSGLENLSFEYHEEKEGYYAETET